MYIYIVTSDCHTCYQKKTFILSLMPMGIQRCVVAKRDYDLLVMADQKTKEEMHELNAAGLEPALWEESVQGLVCD